MFLAQPARSLQAFVPPVPLSFAAQLSIHVLSATSAQRFDADDADDSKTASSGWRQTPLRSVGSEERGIQTLARQVAEARGAATARTQCRHSSSLCCTAHARPMSSHSAGQCSSTRSSSSSSDTNLSSGHAHGYRRTGPSLGFACSAHDAQRTLGFQLLQQRRGFAAEPAASSSPAAASSAAEAPPSSSSSGPAGQNGGGPAPADQEPLHDVHYEGPLSSQHKLLKRISISNTAIAMGAAPLIVQYADGISMVSRYGLAASLVFFGVMTTGALHWVAHPYVHELKYTAATQTVDVRTATMLGRPRWHSFKLSDVQPLPWDRPVATFTAKGNFYYIDVYSFPDEALLRRLTPDEASVPQGYKEDEDD